MELTRREFTALAAATALAGAACTAHADEATEGTGETASAETADRLTAADMVVIGAGAAGLAAAASAAAKGSSVIVLETAASAGGATITSSGFMSFVDDAYNATQERNDDQLAPYLDLSPEDFPGPWGEDLAAMQGQMQEYLSNGEATGRFDSIECALVDHYYRGHGTDPEGNEVALDYNQIRAAIEANTDIVAWLGEEGFSMTGEFVEPRSGLPVSHAGSPEGGAAALVQALLDKATGAGCDIQYGVHAERLTVTDRRVCGVRASLADGTQVSYEAAKGVVVATGPYSSNAALVALYQTYGRGLSDKTGSNNPPTCRGEGLAMAQRCGAAARDLQFITTMFKPYHAMGSSADANAVMAAKQLMVNANAVRFANEDENSAVQSAMNDQPDGLGFAVGDASMLATLNADDPEASTTYAERGWLFTADTLEEAAEQAGLDPQALAATVERYNAAVAAESDGDFGRARFNGEVAEPPFVVAKTEMCYHLTFGGLVADETFRVIGIDGAPIDGLYAAGSVLSGFEGVLHQSGDCMTYVIYSGRTAGAQL